MTIAIYIFAGIGIAMTILSYWFLIKDFLQDPEPTTFKEYIQVMGGPISLIVSGIIVMIKGEDK